MMDERARPRARRWGVLVLAGATCASLACDAQSGGGPLGGDLGSAGDAAAGGDPPPGPAEVQLDELCDIVVTDICTALIECYEWQYRDLDHCRADQECLGMADLAAEVAAGWLSYDAAAVAACHALFASGPCEFGPFLFVPDVHEVLERCPQPLPGSQQEGDACVSHLDCAAGTYCSFVDYTCPGVCREWGAAGDACAPGPELRCDSVVGLRCVEGRCVAPGGVGDACTSRAECGDDLWCDTVGGGVCTAPAGEGEACAGPGADGAACAGGLWCEAQPFEQGVCRGASAEGEPCRLDSHCRDGLVCLTGGELSGTCSFPSGLEEPCDASGDCAVGLFCDAGTCEPLPGAGEPCAGGWGAPACAGELVCDDGLCVDARYPGEPCGSAAACVESLCDGATCRPRARLGEPCVADGDCASRACSGLTCVDATLCFPGP